MRTKSDYGIIYTGRVVPVPLDEERATAPERGMQEVPIRVDPDDLTTKLDPMSRINYAKPQTIDHRHKVKNIGRVHPRSMGPLLDQFRNVLVGDNGPQVELSSAVLQRATAEDEQAYTTLVSNGWSHEHAVQWMNGRRSRMLARSGEHRRAARESSGGEDSDAAVVSGDDT